MGKFSDWILFPGTASPKIREGIQNLGFILAAEIEGFVSFTLPQYLTTEQKTRALGNIGAQPVDAALTSISALTTVADRMIYTTGSDVYATTALTAFARTILDDTTAAAMRTTLGLGTSSTVNTGTSGATVPLLNGANTWAAAQTFSLAPVMTAGATLGSGVSFGSNLGASATDLSKHIALWGATFGFSVTSNTLNYVSSSAHVWFASTTQVMSLSPAGNLTLLGSVGIDSGGTGATTAAAARTNLGLGNVDNTSDANKPVSTAQAAAIALKANLASPAFSGNPTAPTQAPGNSSTRLANTQYVDDAVGSITNGFNSANQVITLGSTVSVAHGLGAVPGIVQFDLVCTTAELGWTAGQVTQVPCGILAISGVGAGLMGVGMEKTATTIVARYPQTNMFIPDKTANNGTASAITPANWRLIVRARL